MAEQRWYATGRRKGASARVYLISPGTGKIMINHRESPEYFRRKILEMIVNQPFELTATEGQFDVVTNVNGGGLSGQAGAIKHGISRALIQYDEELRGGLKKAGHLSRDARVKERKKPGQPGARKKFQFSKR
jgi:small subunit ribosomal protein S9